jgi:hypothetical protein
VRALLAILLAAVSMSITGASAAAPIDNANYVGLLREARDAVVHSHPDDALTTLRALRNDTAGTMHVDQELDPIIADLSATPARVEDALQRLEAAVNVLDRGGVRLQPSDRTAAHSTLDEVYRSRAFENLGGENPQSDPFGDRIRSIGNALGETGRLLLFALLIALVLSLMVRQLRQAAAGRGAAIEADAAPAGPPDATGEWAAAEAAAAAGDHRAAIRHGFRSCLMDVATHGGMPVDPAWTTRELLTRLRAGGEVLAALAPAAAAFDSAWYSGRPIGAADWVQARDRFIAVRALATGAGLALS